MADQSQSRGNSEMSAEFVSSDAWIFLAIAYASSKEPATLSEVVGVADGIEKSIPTYEEMDGAIRRLIQAEWVHLSDDKLALTAAGQAVLAVTGSGAADVYTHWQRIETGWRDGSIRPRRSALTDWYLNRPAFEAAVDGWRRRAERYIELERKLDPYRPMWTSEKEDWYLSRARGGLLPIKRGDPPMALLIDEDDELAQEVIRRMRVAGVEIQGD